MAFTINKEAKTVTPLKDCATCKHLKVCKFHSKMADLCKSNEFYEMNKYLEWNDSLKAFERYSSCQFYSYKYQEVKDGDPVGLNSDPNIVDAILRHSPMPEGTGSYSKDVIKNTLTCNVFDKETKEHGKIEVTLSNIISEYRFSIAATTR